MMMRKRLLAVLLPVCCVTMIGGFSLGLLAAESPRRAPDQSVRNLTLFPGLEASLFASEPLIASPTNIDVDDRGRVWVCEVQNYRGHGARDQRPEGDRILILEDEDGDGVADRTTVFYQGRDVDAALGLCVYDGRVIVTCAPNVIVFSDEDGDDVPDSKTYLFTETGLPQNDHSTHSFVFGPDGYLYWNMGNGGMYVHDADGRQVYDSFGRPVFDRRASRRVPEYQDRLSPFWGGMVFRCALDGTEFEVLGHNFRNNYEVTIDSFGNAWQSDNDDDGNYGVRLNYILEGGNYGYLDELTGESWRVPRISAHANVSSRHWHQNDPGVVPNFVQTGAGSPTGITVYEGDLLPEQFHGKVLHCDAGPGVLWAADSNAIGAGFTAEMVNLVQSKEDKWFRPVDVAVAPDGSLFLSDWYDPVVGWNRQADLGRGRIYRIAPTGVRYRVPATDVTSPEGAVAALQSPAYSIRAKAWLALQRMGNDAENALQTLARGQNAAFRARAFWLLAKLEGRGENYVDEALSDADANIRLVGLRAAVRYRYALSPILEKLVDDPAPSVRRECALTLPRLPADRVAPLWGRLAAQYEGQDRWYLEALGIGAAGRWDACLGDWWAATNREYRSPAARNLIWRSRAASTPGHLAAILKGVPLSAEEIHRIIRAFDFQAWSDAKRSALWKLLSESKPLANSDHWERVRFEALDRLVSQNGANLETKTRDAALGLLADLQNELLRANVIRLLQLTDQSDVLLTLTEPMKNRDLEVRKQAAEAMFEIGKGAEFLKRLRVPDSSSQDYVELAVGVPRSEMVSGLIEVILNSEHSQRTREIALRGLIASHSGAGEVLALARSGRFPEELSDVAGSAFAKTMHVLNRAAAAKWFPVPALKGAESLPGMTEMLVYVGDSTKGRAVFTNTCVECHRLDGQGESFGPDLAQIGAKLSKQGLYESILDPSASISPSYRGVDVSLKDGESLSGLLVSESDAAVVMVLKGVGQRRIQRSEIEELRYLETSLMPSGLQAMMSFNELVDLVEFLKEQR